MEIESPTKKLLDKIKKAKKEKQSRNPNPKTPKSDTDDESTKKSNGNVKIEIDGKIYDVSNVGTKKNGKTAKSLQELEPAKPGIDKPTGKIQSFAKGGRAMYGSGSKVCKLAKRGKGRAYGKNS
tara:strand:+ start:155 stop:526 length:372 start_codon:yes stop_codon:yes gene_type:complete